jgi:hypothetical protein
MSSGLSTSYEDTHYIAPLRGQLERRRAALPLGLRKSPERAQYSCPYRVAELFPIARVPTRRNCWGNSEWLKGSQPTVLRLTKDRPNSSMRRA